MTPAHLHFLCGKPGAGKSTLAASLAAQHSATLLTEDIWMVRLYGDQLKTFDDYLRFAPRVRSVAGPLAVDLLRAGHSVVLDFACNTRASRQWVRTLFEQALNVISVHSRPTAADSPSFTPRRSALPRPAA